MTEKLAIGLMGSADGSFPEEIWAKVFQLGRAVAERGCILITGGCPGLPYAAVQGARAAGGLVVSISPGLSRDEHLYKYESPVEGFDVLICTGSGLMGREVETIRSPEIIVIAGGRSGTLAELAIAYEEGRLIGVLTGTGGITGVIPELVPHFGNKPTGAVVLYDDDPDRLLDRLLEYYRTERYKGPNCSCQPAAGKG